MDALSSKLSTHRLEGRALKRWWQVDSISRKKSMEDKYINGAIRQHITLLILLPFATALYCYVYKDHLSALNSRFFLIAIVVVALIIQLLMFARKHLNRVLEVQVSEIGLDLKSPFLKRSIRWDQIRDFYKTQDDDYILDTTGGDEFILSSELTNSEQLFQSITGRTPTPPTTFSYNHRIRNDFIDSCSMGCLAIIIACLAHLFLGSYTTNEQRIQSIAIATVGILFGTIWWRLHLSRFAYLVRVGEQSFYIRTCTGGREIRWDELINVKQRGVMFYVNTRSGWFVMFADKGGPVSAPLIEFNRKRKLLKQGRT